MQKGFQFEVCTAIVTPMLHNAVNYPMLSMLIKRQLEAGIDTICVAATTGEGSTLSDREKQNIILHAKQYAGDRCRIIAGTGSNDTAHAVALSIMAQQAGADGVLVVTPYYNKANLSGLLAHYSAISEAISIPIILYNVPSRTGMDLSIEACSLLSQLPNVIGLKEASDDIHKIPKLFNACKDDFFIWTGNDNHILPAMAMGCKGVISVVSNLFPRHTLALTAAVRSGDLEKARQLQGLLDPVIGALFSEVNPIPVKAALNHLGYDCGCCRLPLGEMDIHLRDHLISLIDSTACER